MSEPKDPAIKLFGKTIQLPEISAVAAEAPILETDSILAPSFTDAPPIVSLTEGAGLPSSSSTSSTGESNSNIALDEQTTNKDQSAQGVDDSKEENGVQTLTSVDSKDRNANSVFIDTRSPSTDNVNATDKTSKSDEDHGVNSQEKAPKKPDKILPCPRCNSMDTKFCYYNNYNVNQPRHFCKNCQRYWTAGGTMRNVPVGAGRRKSKNLGSHYRQVTAAGVSQNTRTELPNGVQHPSLKLNGTVLAFGSDTPLCESMASVLNIDETAMQNCSDTELIKSELGGSISCEGGENGDDYSGGSSVTAASSKDEVGKIGLQDAITSNGHKFAHQMPFFPGAPWPYPLNSAQWNSPVPPSAYGHAAFPTPLYPAYWGCTLPGTWNGPWINLPPSQSLVPCTSTPNSPTLGKHSRDDNAQKQTNSGEEELTKEGDTDKCLWIPKTLRVKDPGEAAKSSIWTTLGIKNDEADSISASLFRAFPPKFDEKEHSSDSSSALHVNPAALSRSVNFHEGS